MERETLTAVYNKHKIATKRGSDKGTRHSYIEEYEKIFEPIKDSIKTLLEVGVETGISMALWKDYFPETLCIGVDITNSRFVPQYVKDCYIIIGNATHEETFRRINNLDVVIDDGSHRLVDQIRTFQLLFPKLSKNGIYVIEDIQNLEAEKQALLELHPSAEIIDLRNVKDRYDDVLVVYRNA
jgi:hypothetical protein